MRPMHDMASALRALRSSTSLPRTHVLVSYHSLENLPQAALELSKCSLDVIGQRR